MVALFRPKISALGRVCASSKNKLKALPATGFTGESSTKAVSSSSSSLSSVFKLKLVDGFWLELKGNRGKLSAV